MSDRVVLQVGTTWSHCGACGRGAFPDDKSHDRIAGYGPGGPGCGATFTHIQFVYTGKDEEIRKMLFDMRPDLEYVPLQLSLFD